MKNGNNMLELAGWAYVTGWSASAPFGKLTISRDWLEVSIYGNQLRFHKDHIGEMKVGRFFQSGGLSALYFFYRKGQSAEEVLFRPGGLMDTPWDFDERMSSMVEELRRHGYQIADR